MMYGLTFWALFPIYILLLLVARMYYILRSVCVYTILFVYMLPLMIRNKW